MGVLTAFALILVIVVVVVYIVTKVPDTSPAQEIIYRYMGIVPKFGNPKVDEMPITVLVQEKFLTISGGFYHKKMRIHRKRYTSDNLYYQCVDDRGYTVDVIYSIGINSFIISEIGSIIILGNSPDIIKEYQSYIAIMGMCKF